MPSWLQSAVRYDPKYADLDRAIVDTCSKQAAQAVSDEWLTAQDVGEMLKLPAKTVQKYAQHGILPAIKIGSYWRFSRVALTAWLAKKHVVAILLAVLSFGFPVLASAAQVERTLRWQDNSSDEQGFIIEAQRGGSGYYEIARTTAPFYTLRMQRNECYRVRAFNQWGISPPSNVVCGRNFV